MYKPFTLMISACLSAVFLAACQQQSVRDLPQAAQRTSNADDLLVVDCLLPGQVRRLGSQMTYLSARRPIQTTAQDCEIRGGEYVAYDRAGYSEALRIWMPLAEQGDPNAQNKVGEIYERGLGTRPDYTLASVWYRRAAEQGYERAQINLGFLLEKGLGTRKDQAEALAWYRKASKLPDAVMIDKVALEEQQARISSLQQDLQRSSRELEKARKKQRAAERRLREQRSKLLKKLPPKGDASLSAAQRKSLQKARKKLDQQRAELAQSQRRIAELESKSRQQQENLLLLETEGASQREQLRLVREQLGRSRSELRKSQSQAADNETRLVRTKAELAALGDARNSEAQQRISQLQGTLAQREQALSEQQIQVERLRKRSDSLKQQVAESERTGQANLASVRRELDQARAELARAKSSAGDKAQALEQTQGQLQALKASQDAAGIRVSELEAQLKESEAALAENRAKVASLNKQADQWKQKLEKLEAEKSAPVSRTAEADVPTAPPSIQLIEPPLMAVRSATENRIPVKRGLKKRTVVGKVAAPSGLYSFTVNGAKTKLNQKGLF